MNIPAPVTPVWLSVIVGVSVSWALSCVIEALVWWAMLAGRMGKTRLPSVLGWLALVQLVSTPLSFGIMLLLGAFAFVVTPIAGIEGFWTTLTPGASLYWNPVGLVVGFLFCPIVLELLFWRDARSRLPDTMSKIAGSSTGPLTTTMLAAGCVLANSASFSAGVVFPFNPLWSMFIFLMVFAGIVPFAVLVWFLVASRQSTSRFGVRERIRNTAGDSKETELEIDARSQSFKARRHRLLAFLEGLAIALFIVLPLVSSPAMDSLATTAVPGPSGQQALIDNLGRLHVVWEDSVELPNQSLLATIKYRCLDGQTWSQEYAVSAPRVASWQFGWGSRVYFPSSTTMTCYRNGSLAVGWLHRGSGGSLDQRTATAYYRVLNGTAWEGVETLPCGNATTLALRYDSEGVLHALWFEEPYHYGYGYSSWRICHWPVGSSQPPLAISNSTDTLGDPSNPVLLSGNDGRLCALWKCWGNDTRHTSVICSRTYSNGSWSELAMISDPLADVFLWTATDCGNGSIHVVWHAYQSGSSGERLYYRRMQAGIWEPTMALYDDYVNAAKVAADAQGNVHVIWEYPDRTWASRKLINSTWQAATPVTNLPMAYTCTSILSMASPTKSHSIWCQYVGSTTQLTHLTLDSDVAYPGPILASGVPTLAFRLSLYVATKGLFAILGALTLLPAVAYLLRRSLPFVLGTVTGHERA